MLASVIMARVMMRAITMLKGHGHANDLDDMVGLMAEATLAT